ncbi:hypothetical protein GDO81_005665 [Engystomops pustulosus]|uniref:Uncharacterized protein n=1 Tax=Engystomops pustulosus TaxID=76066 RepID=A0AAV7CTM2_ENGPU|nr:hypothetical protein GDO81_005665 [Engystomops pustulosus]
MADYCTWRSSRCCMWCRPHGSTCKITYLMKKEEGLVYGYICYVLFICLNMLNTLVSLVS